ncbi:MAG: alcohol dehydrogenase catalytic domain-containing protein [Planctomycetota bacterium]|nr:MAG: alcohol dehydrogenase catalytic domain-containing protein [Planctomycetota bacterium]
MKAQNTANLPETQHAVQLVGADELVLNKSKEVFRPGRHQILCRVEAVGLCFSDLKLLKQFSSHARKGEIVSGIDPGILKEIPSYAPGDIPTVPGHEAVVRIASVGMGVESFKVGQRYLVETDYRWLPTASSNASFGYNFEGGLQEYVLMDERVITSPEGDLMLIPVSEGLSASAIALVEPWACVEDAYATKERRRLKRAGRMLVVAETELTEDVFGNLFERYGWPAQITWLSKFAVPSGLDIGITKAADISEISDASYDDVICLGSKASTIEVLFGKVAPQGLVNIVLCGGKFGRDVVTAVGRVHYGGIRIVGTTGTDPAESMEYIPETGEVRAGDKINVVGAGGPMGTMHVIRNICQDIEGISVFAGDIDEDRLATLSKVAELLAKKNNVRYKPYNSGKEQIGESFDYTVVMAPIPELVSASVKAAEKGGIINIFAGIPADVTATIDLDACIEKRLYFIGTSGSVLEDMKRVLAKVESGRLDTDVSVAAVCGLDGSDDGIRAVEKRQIAGKIMVYPACKGFGLTELTKLGEKMPEVAECLSDGVWNKKAEDALLKIYQKSQSGV